MAEIEWLLVTFRFGGYWIEVKNKDRKKYEGGKQKTIKIDKDLLCLFVLVEEFERICPWLRGHAYQFYYHICGTSPKEYKLIINDENVLEMRRLTTTCNRAEIVIVIQEDITHQGIILDTALEHETRSHVSEVLCLQSEELNIQSHILEKYPSYFDWHLNDQIINDVQLSVGARFTNSGSFKDFLRTKAIEENFGLKIKASNKTQVIAVCSHKGCPWRIRAALCVDGETFEVRKLEALHSCPGINRAGNKQATCTWVANQIEDMVKKYPDIPPKQIKHSLEIKYGLSLPYMKVWRSREVARDNIFGPIDDNYRWVPTLRAELIKRNPGSHIIYNLDCKDNSFQRFYVSFKVCIDGFLSGCRPLIGLDACHLKSKYLGVLLEANTLDGNNGLYTIAFAVVESESKKTWMWFLKNLFKSFGSEIEPLAFMSDMEKGLGEAIKIIFPNAEHRICMRHLWKNVKKNYHCRDSHKLRSIVWATSNAYTKYEYDAKVNELFGISPQLHSYLLALPYKWSKSQFLDDIKNNYNTNNMSESFNAWIGECRGKPVVDLIDMIRGMIMVQRSERKMNALKWRGELVPMVEEYMREVTTRKEQFIIRQSSPNRAEVEGHFERHEVDIEHKHCTCRFWQVAGLPCIHAVAFIGTREISIWHTYINKYFHVIRYNMAYEGEISTLPGREQWDVVDDGIQVGVPNTIRPRGRPKKRRMKSFLENNIKKPKYFHKCSRCGILGHHRNSCKNPLGQSSQDTSLHFELPFATSGVRSKLPVMRAPNIVDQECS